MIIYRHKEKYAISEMCKFFSVSRGGYYDYVKRMDIPAKDLPLAEKIRECQEKCGRTYGYRRVHIWLERNGIHHDPKTILRVMQKYCLLSQIRRKKYHNYGEYLLEPPSEKKKSLQTCNSTVTKAFSILHSHTLSQLNHTALRRQCQDVEILMTML